MQREISFDDLPTSSLDAHTLFVTRCLPQVRAVMEEEGVSALAIILPPAGPDHDAWRRALAGDLAREYAPRRVNVAGGSEGDPLDAVLSYLQDAPGVTGHYVQAHD